MKQWAILQNGTGILVVWLAGGAIADIGITVVITWHIRRHAVNFKQRQDPLSRLVRLYVFLASVTASVADNELQDDLQWFNDDARQCS